MPIEQPFHTRKTFLVMGPQDEQVLVQLAEVLEDILPDFVSDFYDHLMRFPEMRLHFPDASSLQRHKMLLLQYFSRLTSGVYDQSYGEERERVGLAHARINLPPGWYLGAYSYFMCRFLQCMQGREHGLTAEQQVAALQALTRVIFLDMGIAIDTYINLRDQMISGLRGYSTAFAHLPYGTLVIEVDGSIIFCNEAFARLMNRESEQLAGQPLAQWIQGEDLPRMIEEALQLDYTARLLSLRGVEQRLPIPVSVTMHPLPHTATDSQPQLLLTVQDMRQQEQLQRDLLQAQEVARIGTWQTLFDGYFNLSLQASRLLGLSEQVRHSNASLLSALDSIEGAQMRGQWDRAMQKNNGCFVSRCRHAGEERWLEIRYQVERDMSDRPLRAYGTMLDITERYLAEQEMRRLALNDGLTGLYNRKSGLEQLQEMMYQAGRNDQQVVVMFADLDRFKEINDSQGHAVGDRVLQRVARQLEDLLQGDDILARMGGDEFLLARRLRNGENPVKLAGQINQLLSAPLLLNDRAYSLGVSVGVAIYPQHAQEVSEVLHCADLAMYQAKSQGGGPLLYEETLGLAQQRRVQLAAKLQQALADNKLELHYQPKINIASGQLEGMEALARWHDQDWGWISPGEFIPVAEERGLIAALDSWGLNTAAKQWKSWRDAGYPNVPPIAVNISAVEISMLDSFAERTQAVTRALDVPAQALELEITESALAQNVDKVAQTTKSLVEMGFSLAIDDFGTGYSSLARLHSLPLSVLKVDMVFVRNMLIDSGSMAIVTAIISMARALGIKTIAEGVETAEQLEALRALQCDTAQGFLFSPALPASELEAQWLSNA